jgi:hypothetical protein
MHHFLHFMLLLYQSRALDSRQRPLRKALDRLKLDMPLTR